jgi:HAE1 family hydrophobic/amphiphilic exporter-1
MVSAFVSLTLVPMLASRFLTDEAHKKRPGALVRFFERGFDRTLAAVHAHARRRRCATASVGAAGVALPPSWPPAWLFYVIPKGFFPQEDIGQMQVSTEAAEDTSFERWCSCRTRGRDLPRRPGGGHGELVQRRQRRAEHRRMFINLKPRASARR